MVPESREGGPPRLASHQTLTPAGSFAQPRLPTHLAGLPRRLFPIQQAGLRGQLQAEITQPLPLHSEPAHLCFQLQDAVQGGESW